MTLTILLHRSDPDLSFLAARYLRHVLTAPVVGNDLFYVAVIWHHYMVVAATNRDAIEWPNFDECLNIIYDSNTPSIACVSPVRLVRLKNALFGCVIYNSCSSLLQVAQAG